MKTRMRSLLAALAVCLAAHCGAPGRNTGITPESVGAVPLTGPAMRAGPYGAAAGAVMREVACPEEFYAAVDRKGDDILVFHLWHRDAFKRENAHMNGNPGGKCRDVHYSERSGRVVNVFFWQ